MSAKTAAVLQLDPDLLGGMGEPRAAQARQACHAQVIELPRGRWQVDQKQLDPSGFGLLVLSGILCRQVVQSECNGAELIGPGDLMRPWDQLGEWSTIPTESSWLVLQPTRLAVLDSGFARRAGPFPEIASELLRRGLLRSRYLVILVAIISQRRIDTRLTMLFWHLADRFGRRSGEWVEIPVPLTHATLAELVAARRPSVTTALSRLNEEGVLRRGKKGWLLRGTVPPELLEVDEAGAPGGIGARDGAIEPAGSASASGPGTR